MFGSSTFLNGTSSTEAATISNTNNNNNEDMLGSTQTFLSETLRSTQRQRDELRSRSEQQGGSSPRMFQGLTLKSLLMWEKPKESMIIAGTLLGFIVVFGIMEYTMLTFICRLLQLVLLCFLGANYLGKPLATSQEIVEYAKLLHDMFLPLIWDTVDFLARIITWESRSTTTEVFVGTIVLGALGNFFSDLTLIFFCTVAFFVCPILYVKNKAVVDGHLAQAKVYLDRLIAQSSEHLKAAAASLSPNHSPARSSAQSQAASPTNRSGADAGAPPLYSSPIGKDKSA